MRKGTTELLLASLFFAAGCASTALPPRLSATQRAEITATQFRATVGVEEFSAPVYSRKLVEALQQTNLFSRVDLLSNFSQPPDLIARIERGISGTAVIPLMTIISLGLIPTTVDEEHGFSFSLRRSRGGERVPIDFSYKGPTTLGLASVFLNMQPNRTSGDPEHHRDFLDNLSWTIVSRKAEILALLPP